MNRREFIMLLGGAAAAWPLAARAQRREKMRRIGVLMPFAADDPEAMARIGAFLQGLGELGWTVGRNLRIDYRWDTGEAVRTRNSAAELLALAPDVILATGTPSLVAVQQITRTVPIVFVNVADPVGAGFALFEYGLSAKWLELLKEIAPRVTRAAVLRDPTNAAGIGQWGAIQSVAPSLAVELSPVDVRDA